MKCGVSVVRASHTRFRIASAVAASAGNVNSIESSDVVTSTAVPNVADGGKERQLISVRRAHPHEGRDYVIRLEIPGGIGPVFGCRVTPHLLEQRG